MAIVEIVNDTIVTLEELSEIKRRQFAAKNYPTALKIIGVVNPNLKIVLKELLIITKLFSDEDKIDLSKQFIRTNIIECQQLAYEFLDNNRETLKTINEIDIIELQGCFDNWVVVDYYAAIIVGFPWHRNIITIDTIRQFYQSADFWIRRIALVATVSLNQKARGGTGDSWQTLEICKLAVADHADMITKALSFALRVLIKVDRQGVISFIEEHESVLHARVLREVRNKLCFGTKN